jgi:hypothetical protein
MSSPHTPPYTWGQTVTLPRRFWADPHVAVAADIRFVDEVDRFVRVWVDGYMQAIPFEELDQAQAVTA